MQMKKTAAIALAFASWSVPRAWRRTIRTGRSRLLVPVRRRRRHRHGGAGDRAQSMSKLLGQPIVIENAAGAGGTIAATRASRAEPDGYTLMIHHIGISTAATLYAQAALRHQDRVRADRPRDQRADDDHRPSLICRRTRWPSFVTYIKANGDKMTFGNARPRTPRRTLRTCCS